MLLWATPSSAHGDASSAAAASTPVVLCHLPVEVVLAVSLALLIVTVTALCCHDSALVQITLPPAQQKDTIGDEADIYSGSIGAGDVAEAIDGVLDEPPAPDSTPAPLVSGGADRRRPAKSPARPRPAKSPARTATKPARNRGDGGSGAGGGNASADASASSIGGRGGSGQYIQINGERYDRSLIELAQSLRAAKSNFTLGKSDVSKLWQDAKDGPGVTDTERKTLTFIRDTFALTSDAKTFLSQQIEVSPSGNSYYATIPGRKRSEPSTVVDRAMWDEIVMLARDGNIDLGDARKVWSRAQDGPGVTLTERRTLERALKDFAFTQGGRDFLVGHLAELPPEA